MKDKLVGVYPSLEALPPTLRSALARLFPVRFESGATGCDPASLDAALVLPGSPGGSPPSCPPGLRCYRVSLREGPEFRGRAGNRVQFGDSQSLDQRLRQRSLPHGELGPICAISPQDGDEVLARLDGHPVWVLRTESGFPMDVVGLAPPELADGERAFDYLNEGHYLRLLPLFHFLRQVTSGSGWEPPPLRACLMFDDPNLHWRSYGFLDYRRLVALARQGGFHVAMATVPLDSWGSHRQTVRLFKESTRQISLLVHGNDHTRVELGRERSSEEHLRMLAQALRRISRFEQTTGAAVARVMAPPHGAYARPGLAAMFELGFEGACISAWSLRDWAPQMDWPATFGLEMAELMDAGFPVIPRFRLSESCEAAAVIAAFLDRPIIPVGHHVTVAEGLDLLGRTARMINSLGGVQWGSPEMVLRSNYASRREGSTLVIRPYAARLRFQVPPAVTGLRIDPPAKTRFRVVSEGAGAARSSPSLGEEPIPVRAGEDIEVAAEGWGITDFTRVARPSLSCWALPRRLLCEARDRLQPMLYTVRHLGSATPPNHRAG